MAVIAHSTLIANSEQRGGKQHGFRTEGMSIKPARIAGGISSAHGLRGFRTFEPPPEGCMGWKEETAQQHSGTAEPVPVDDKIPTAAPLDSVQPTAACGQAAIQEQLRRELAPEHIGPLKDLEHLRAAVDGDLEALQETDVKLRETLEADNDVLSDEAASEAMRLYRHALTAFDPGPEQKRLAFQAVIRDDEEMVRTLLEYVQWDAQNAGGQTLLEVATDRQKFRAQAAIEAAREAQLPMIQAREKQQQELAEEKQRKRTEAAEKAAEASATAGGVAPKTGAAQREAG